MTRENGSEFIWKNYLQILLEKKDADKSEMQKVFDI